MLFRHNWVDALEFQKLFEVSLLQCHEIAARISTAEAWHDASPVKVLATILQHWSQSSKHSWNFFFGAINDCIWWKYSKIGIHNLNLHQFNLNPMLGWSGNMNFQKKLWVHKNRCRNSYARGMPKATKRSAKTKTSNQSLNIPQFYDKKITVNKLTQLKYQVAKKR